MERDIIARLADEGGSFSKRQRSIAKYICDNCDKAAFMTAEMLSRSAGVSESTVVRFATELGYDGYPGMRRALQGVMRDRLAAPRRPAAGDDASREEELFISSLEADAEALRATAAAGGERYIDGAVRAIAEAGTVYIAGFGAFAALADYMGSCMRLSGRNALAVSGDLFEKLWGIAAGDVFIELSDACGCREGTNAAKLARDRGAAVIVLCESEQNLALRYACLHLTGTGGVGILSLINAVVAASGRNVPAARKEIQNIRMEYDRDEQ